MLIRKGFITNSSSTSFIFFGICLEYGECQGFVSKLKEHASEAHHKWHEHDLMQNFAEKLQYNDKKSPVGMHHGWEINDLQIYPKAGFIGLDECGIDDFPIEKIKSFTTEQEEEWMQILKEFCAEWDLPYRKPSWSIAIHVER
jgi:hypothetical protein